MGGDDLAFSDFLKGDFLDSDIVAVLDEWGGAILQLSNSLGEKIDQHKPALRGFECPAEQLVLAHRKTPFLLPSAALTRGSTLGAFPHDGGSHGLESP